MMSRKVQLIVDASTDFSTSLLERHQVIVLPIRLRIDDQLHQYDGEEGFRQAFYQQLWRGGECFAQVEPSDGNEISIWLEQNAIYSPFRLQLLTGNAQRTQLFEQSQQAIADNLQVFKRLRLERGIYEHFNIKILGSRLMFGGQTILACEASRMADEGAVLADISFYLQAAAKRVSSMIVPGDMAYLRSRGVEESLGWSNAKALSMKKGCPVITYRDKESTLTSKEKSRDHAIAAMFKHLGELIEKQQLEIPLIVISQAEAQPSLQENGAFPLLRDLASRHGITIELCSMSPASAIASGVETIAASWLQKGK